MSADQYFPVDYFAARAGFRAQAAGERFSHTLPATGPGGEALSIDGVYVGPAVVSRLVVFTSGVHGVEGYAGSALQQLWLAEFAGSLPAGTGVLLVHALNPYGFAHGRRVNESNVDLNRNALAAFPGPVNAGYRALNDWLNPATPAPAVDDFLWRGLPLLVRHGRAALAQAVAGGQYEFRQGLFYGGSKREESLAVLAVWLQQARFAGVREVWHFDLHTGLGRRGEYQFLLEAPLQSPAYQACVQVFGAHHVKSDHASDAAHYSAHGVLAELTHRAFPAAQVVAVTVEFGTLGPATMLRVLRAENRLHHHGAAGTRRAERIRQAMREACAPADRAWREAVIVGGREIFARLQGELVRRTVFSDENK